MGNSTTSGPEGRILEVMYGLKPVPTFFSIVFPQLKAGLVQNRISPVQRPLLGAVPQQPFLHFARIAACSRSRNPAGNS